jgi:hypothetical protein
LISLLPDLMLIFDRTPDRTLAERIVWSCRNSWNTEVLHVERYYNAAGYCEHFSGSRK